LSDFTGSNFTSGIIQRYQIQTPPDYSYQIEGITFQDADTYYLTSEEFMQLKSALYKLDLEGISGIGTNADRHPLIYPNPASDIVTIHDHDAARIEIYNLQGVLLKYSKHKQIHVAGFERGTYIFMIKNMSGNNVRTQKLIIE
jgi:hypothetical protein